MRRTFVAVLSIIVLVSVVGSVPVAANGDAVTLTVSVVNQDGQDIGDATVVATWNDSETTGTTKSNGRVFIDVPKGADVKLDIEDERYVRNRPVVVSDAAERDVEIRVSEQATASVSVTDADGQSLDSATVKLKQDGMTVASGETNSAGIHHSAVVEKGDYTVTAVKPGYFESSTELFVENNTETELELESGRVSLEIEVVDDHFEPPETLTDARVQVESEQFDANVSTTEGSASLNVPVNTRYKIIASKPGYEGTPRSLTVNEEPRTVTAAAQRSPEFEVSAESTKVVVGERTRIEVRNAYDEPAKGVTVEVNGEEVGETDDRGEISVQIDAVGDNTLVATDNGVESDPITVTGVETDAEAEESGESSEDGSSDTTSEESPGFGVTVGIISVIVAFAVLAVRRR